MDAGFWVLGTRPLSDGEVRCRVGCLAVASQEQKVGWTAVLASNGRWLGRVRMLKAARAAFRVLGLVLGLLFRQFDDLQ